jgi:hypothetical protein
MCRAGCRATLICGRWDARWSSNEQLLLSPILSSESLAPATRLLMGKSLRRPFGWEHPRCTLCVFSTAIRQQPVRTRLSLAGHARTPDLCNEAPGKAGRIESFLLFSCPSKRDLAEHHPEDCPPNTKHSLSRGSSYQAAGVEYLGARDGKSKRARGSANI